MNRGERIGAYVLIALWVLEDFLGLIVPLAVFVAFLLIAIAFGGGHVDVDYP